MKESQTIGMHATASICTDEPLEFPVTALQKADIADVVPFLENFSKLRSEYRHDAFVEMTRLWAEENELSDDGDGIVLVSHILGHAASFSLMKTGTWAPEQVLCTPRWLDDDELVIGLLNDTPTPVQDLDGTVIRATVHMDQRNTSVDFIVEPCNDISVGSNNHVADATALFAADRSASTLVAELDEGKEVCAKRSTALDSIQTVLPTAIYQEVGSKITILELNPRQLEDQSLEVYHHRNRDIMLGAVSLVMKFLLSWQMLLTLSLVYEDFVHGVMMIQSYMLAKSAAPKDLAIVLLLAITFLGKRTRIVPIETKRWLVTLLVLHVLLLVVFSSLSVAQLHSQAAVVMAGSDALLLVMLNLMVHSFS